jgi:ABC-type transport system substrate-binding protein
MIISTEGLPKASHDVIFGGSSELVKHKKGERKMNRKLVLLSIALLSMLMISAFPVKAWVYPDGHEDDAFELYGPHVAGILCKLYANEQAEWTAMDNDELDFEDWPLTAAWVEAWQDDPRFQLANYGGEAGYFILDFNNNGDLLLQNGDPNPAIDPEMGINVMTILSFRQALACMVNRTYIVDVITLGFGLPMWTPVPTYMTTFVHPDIKPGGSLENITYGGMNKDIARAEAYLNDDGFLYNPGEYAWRFYDKNGNGHYDAGEEFTLIFYSRSDSLERLEFADDYVIELTSDPIKIQVDYRPRDRAECSNKVFGAKEFHMYTGGWIFIGPDPDYLYDLHHSTMYWHPGKPPNYGDGYDALMDGYAEDIKFATTVAAGQTAAYDFQKRFADLAWSVPLWCASGIKAYRRVPVNEPGPAEWKGIVNQVGFGMNSWWTFLNLMKECEFYPPIYATYGFKTTTIDWLNPVYAEWYWDWEVLGKIYDGCAARNPYDLGLFVPQLAKTWEVGLWKDPNTQEMKSKVRITLRPDLYWQDGTPVTVADLAYTWVESVDALLEKDLIPPWWYPTVQYFRSFFIIDPLNVEILLDVQSVWAVGWVIGTVVIPKHIWKPIIDSSTQLNNIVHNPQPDPNCIGSGPFRFVQYVPEDKCELVANTPGSIVHSVTSPGYWQYCPIHVNVICEDYKNKFDPGYPNTNITLEFAAIIQNLWLNQCNSGVLDGMKYIYVDNELIESHYIMVRSNCRKTGIQMVLEIVPPPFEPTQPFGTTWHELTPEFSWMWTVIDWLDSNLNGIVDYCDWLYFIDMYGNILYAHVAGVDPLHLESDFVIFANVEVFSLPLTKCMHTVKVAFHVESPQMLDLYHPNPWICQWINVTLPIWITIKQDVGGAMYLGKVPAPDCKVDGKDIAYASSAFNTVPGMKKWSPVADITGDYKVDGKDIANIAKYYGKW